MSTPMRAKLVVSSVQKHEGGTETLRFRAVCKSDGYPSDGSDENNTYARFSPSASCEIQVANPDLHNKFKPGDTFYVDFTPAD
jgi:hypothetical protein